MNWKVPLAETSFSDAEFEAVRRVLNSGWVSMGPETADFEKEFATYLNVAHAVAVSSGTAALHLALLAFGIGPGDDVIVPSLTFVATANAVRYVGARPVFADISGHDNWNVSPESIANKVTPMTKAVIVVHYAGFPCCMDDLERVARKHDLTIIEDAAHAPGASFNGRALGTWGDAGCFSFFSNKNMTSAEGGMVVTNDPTVASKIAVLRSHGMTSLTWDRHRGHNFSYDVIGTGYNYRMDELRASVGRAQLMKLSANNQRRRELTRFMREVFRSQEGMRVPFRDDLIESSACHIFPILLDSSILRESFMQYLKEAGIQTSIHYPPVHRFSSYANLSTKETEGLSLTEDVAAREVTLPLFPTMTSDQTDMVCDVVRGFFAQGDLSYLNYSTKKMVNIPAGL